MGPLTPGGQGRPPRTSLQNHGTLIFLRQTRANQVQGLGKGQLGLLTGFHILVNGALTSRRNRSDCRKDILAPYSGSFFAKLGFVA